MNKKIVGLLVATALISAPSLQAASFSPDQIKDIQKILHDYLVSNPEVLQEGILALQAKKNQEHQAQATAAIAQNKDALLNDSQDPVLGNPQGSQVMVAFLDPFCGHCRNFHKVIDEAVSKDKNLKIIVKNLPVLGAPSLLAVKALMAAQMQGQYSGAQAFMQTADPKQNVDDLVKGLSSLKGFDVAKFKAALASPAMDTSLTKMRELAEKIGISATPSLIINEHLIEGGVPYEILEKLLKGEAPDKAMAS